jgi:VCBS repeat-containing protein
MRILSLLNRIPDYIVCLFLLSLSISLFGQSSYLIADIPNQEILERQVFPPIIRDDFVADPDNAWGFDGATFTVTALNDAPVANDDAYGVAEGGTLNVASAGVLINDTDVDSDPLTAVLVSGPTKSISFALNPNGSFSYTHDGSETINDFFTYQAFDGALYSATATVNITITPVNDPPVVTDIPNQSIAEDGSFATINLDNFVSDVDNADNQMIWTYSGNSQLTVSISGSRVATITTPANWNGAETITFIATDPLGGTDSDPATFTVTAVNDPPVVTDIPDQSIAEDGSFATINLDNFVSDVDNADNQMIWTYSGNSQLTVSISGSRVATITTPANWNGAETITFIATDPLGGTDSDPATFTVTAVNDPPVLTDPSSSPVNYTENSPAVQLTNTISVSDVDNIQLISASIAITSGFQTTEDVLSFTAVGGISGSYNSSTGILSLTGTSTLANYQTILRSIKYNNTSENPTITDRIISFTVSDGSGSNPVSNIINKTVTITAVNDPPVASDVAINPADSRIGIVNTGDFTFSDPDGDNPGTNIYKWYRSDNLSGIPAAAIPGATALTYKPVKPDGGKYICFEITPVDEHTLAGVPVKSSFKYINAAPVASNAHVYAPGTIPGQLIRGRFTYADAENNPRGNATYQWYRKNTASFSPSIPGTPISTDSIYQLKGSDAGKYLWFKVKPVATAGSTPGDSIWSNIIGPIGDFSANITGSAVYCAGVTMPITLTVTGGVAPFVATLRRSGTSNKDTTISGISVSPYVMQVKIPGSYVLLSLSDASSPTPDNATVSAIPVLLTINPKPKALLTGSQSICNDGITRAGLSVNFTSGTAPWNVTVRRRENPAYDTVFTDVSDDPFLLHARVIGPTPTRHRIIAITDVNSCPGDTASGSAWVSYKASPTAVISETDSICPGESATLKVTLTTGTPDWGFTYLRNGANPVTIPKGISGLTYNLNITNTGTYTLSGVSDQVCTGRGSGTGYVRSYAVPTALLSGTANICEHTSTSLNIALNGKAPWRFSYRLVGIDTVEVLNVNTSPHLVSVNRAGTYSLIEVYDQNCKGTVSGSAVISIIPAPEVTFSGLAPAYNKETFEIVTISGTPSGGIFTGTGVFGPNPDWVFFPRQAGVGTHTIVYSYRASPSSCYGYDTAIVRVLEADAVIEFENGRTKYCMNDGPFTITGANIALDTGSFSISGNVGLTDHHNNTATIDPALLNMGEYTITYNYEMLGTIFPWTSKFEIGTKPIADFSWATECFQSGQPIAFKENALSSFGYLNDTLFFWKIYTNTGYSADTARNITHTFPEPGNHRIELQIKNTYGCSDTVTKIFSLRPTKPLDGITYFEDFETKPIEWQSDSASSAYPVNSWKLGTPSKHGAPPRGFSGASSGEKCWYTYIPNNTAPLEQSWVTSPCFDFTGTERPMLKVWIWRSFTDIRDGANLQASSDSGKSWTAIGLLNDGINWFNEYQITAKPGDEAIGWSNIKDAGWIESRHSLDFLKGRSQVQFRIAYGATGSALRNDGIAFDDFSIIERNRTALIEHFTNISDIASAAADSALDEFILNYGSTIIDLQYHTADPPNDPFYADNPVIPTTREFYYGLSSVPYAILDGGSKSEHRFPYSKTKFIDKNAAIIESLLDSKFQINLTSEIHDNTLTVVAQVSALQVIPLTEISVRIAVIERVIGGITGVNGDTSFRSVVKTMLPGAAGTTIYKAWNPGDYRDIEQSWELQHVYDLGELRVVAFIQNEESTYEIYQAALDTITVPTGINDPLPRSPVEKSFIVYPNPAERVVNVKFSQETLRDITIEIYNNLGRLVYSTRIPAGTDKTEIPVENFPDGLYLLRLMSNDKLIGNSKLIISK